MPESGKHQNVRRATMVLSVLAAHAASGARLTDVAAEVGLGKGTVHRVLAGLVENGLADCDERTGRFFLGVKIISWGTVAKQRFGLADQVRVAMETLSQKTQDTVYLTIRVGDEAVYIERKEGTYPVKALTVNVGARRPLGVGSGPLAILMALGDEEIARILECQRAERLEFGLDDAKLLASLAAARRQGYTRSNVNILPDMDSVGIPILGESGAPVGAISIAAVSSRMTPDRRESVAALIRDSIRTIKVYD